MSFNEYPKTLYRYDESGERIGKTFASEDAVEPGWVCIDDLGPAPAKKAAPAMSGADSAAAGKRLAEAERANASMRDTIKLYEDQTAADAKTLAAYKAFLDQVRTDPGCPADLKAAISELLDGKPAEEPKPKTKKK